jgi:hypothetical protein
LPLVIRPGRAVQANRSAAPSSNVKQPCAIARILGRPRAGPRPLPRSLSPPISEGARNAGLQPAHGPCAGKQSTGHFTTDRPNSSGVPHAVFEACSVTTPEDRHHIGFSWYPPLVAHGRCAGSSQLGPPALLPRLAAQPATAPRPTHRDDRDTPLGWDGMRTDIAR